MALLFCDSFDHYDTRHIQDKYNTIGSGYVQIVTGAGRGGSNSARLTYDSALSRPIPTSTTVIAGFAFKDQSGSQTGGFLFALLGAHYSDPEFAIVLDATGALFAALWGGPPLGSTASGVVQQGTYVYLEVKVVCALDATGSIVLRANGVTVLSLQNIVTMRRTVNTTVVALGGQRDSFFDDFYICDATGALNADFLGDVKIALAMPNGNGRVNTWAQTGGTPGQNYTSVNETPPDDDTSYVSSSTVSAADLYTIASVGTPAAIVGVQLVSLAKKDDAGTRVLSLGFGNGTTESFDAGTSLGTDYTFVRRTLDQNPLTNAPWAPADLTGAQIGVSVVS